MSTFTTEQFAALEAYTHSVATLRAMEMVGKPEPLRQKQARLSHAYRQRLFIALTGKTPYLAPDHDAVLASASDEDHDDIA